MAFAVFSALACIWAQFNDYFVVLISSPPVCHKIIVIW
jgi:hypothetical protein